MLSKLNVKKPKRDIKRDPHGAEVAKELVETFMAILHNVDGGRDTCYTKSVSSWGSATSADSMKRLNKNVP